MEIHACEVGGVEELLKCSSCCSADLDPLHQEGATGVQSWGMMTRLAVKCAGCGEEEQLSWDSRVKFRFTRTG